MGVVGQTAAQFNEPLPSHFQAEIFAKPVTDGASAARRHLGKSVMPCLINHLAASRRRSIFKFQAA